MSDAKTKPTADSVEAFLNAIEDDRKREDCMLLRDLMTAASGKPAVMWGAAIVGFSSYHYTYASGRSGDAPIIAFSPRKQAISLYIKHGYPEYEELLAKLGKHTTGKGCLYVKRMADIDLSVLNEILVRSIAFMSSDGPPAP